MAHTRTLFLRLDTDPREGRADVAHVRVTNDAGGPDGFVGEISGTEDVVDAEHVAVVTTENPWDVVSGWGYSQVADDLHGPA